MNDLSILLPAEWKIVHLGSKEPLICDQIKNGTTINQNKNKEGIKVTRIKTIANSVIDEHAAGYTTEVTPKILNDYLIKKGDILFSHINSDAHIGKSAIAKKDYDDLIHGMNLLLIRPNKQNTIPEYINYVFIYFRAIGFFKKICKRAVNQSSINQANLKTIEMPLPSILEQRKIADVLSSVQKAVEIQAKLIERTTELKNAMIHKLFTEGTRGEKQKMTEIGLVPESWEVVEIGKIMKQVKKNYIPSLNGTKKYIGLEHIDSGLTFLSRFGIESEVKSSKYIFTKGQFLYGKLRPYLDKAAMPDFDGICSTDIIVLDCVNVSNLFGVYLLHAEKFIEYAKKTTTGVQHPRTSWSNLKKLKIGLPSQKERGFITDSLKNIDQKIRLHTNKKQKLEELFRTLLHQLMTAEIRVNDIDLSFLKR